MSAITSVPGWSPSAVAALNEQFQLYSAGQTAGTWTTVASNVGVDRPYDAAAIARIPQWSPGALTGLAGRFGRDSGGRDGAGWAAVAGAARRNDLDTSARFAQLRGWSTGSATALSTAHTADRGGLSAAQWAVIATNFGTDEDDATAGLAQLPGWSPGPAQALARAYASDDLGATPDEWVSAAAEVPSTGDQVAAVQALLEGGEVPPDPRLARLVALELRGAEQTDTGAWYQSWSADQRVRIRALTEPEGPEVAARIAWHGGEPDVSGADDMRALPLDTLTEPGAPLEVTASLNGERLAVAVAVVPDLVRLEVINALSEGGERWALTDAGPVVLRAVAAPDTPAAYRQLVWTGGEVDPTHPYDRRIVRDADIEPDTGELRVGVAVQLP